MNDFNFAPDRWEFWRELPDPDDSQYEEDEEEEECEDQDNYDEELCAARRRSEGRGYLNEEDGG